MLDLERLAATDEEVARLTAPARKERVYALMNESFDLLNLAIDQHVAADRKLLAGSAPPATPATRPRSTSHE